MLVISIAIPDSQDKSSLIKDTLCENEERFLLEKKPPLVIPAHNLSSLLKYDSRNKDGECPQHLNKSVLTGLKNLTERSPRMNW